MLDVAASASKEIIDANYISPLCDQAIAKVRAKKPRSAGDQYSLFKMHQGDLSGVVISMPLKSALFSAFSRQQSLLMEAFGHRLRRRDPQGGKTRRYEQFPLKSLAIPNCASSGPRNGSCTRQRPIELL
jgi:hypothetical protein